MEQTKKIILDKYFYLSDYAVKEKEAFESLLGLFSKEAVLEPYNSDKIRGKEEIKTYFTQFFKNNTELRHVWKTVENMDNFEIDWIMCGKSKDGELFTLQGKDTAKVDKNGKISYLKVENVK